MKKDFTLWTPIKKKTHSPFAMSLLSSCSSAVKQSRAEAICLCMIYEHN